ncbi:MAG: subtype B tannase [Bacteroidota bacterium]
MHNRILISVALTACEFLIGNNVRCQNIDTLVFLKDNYTLETKTVRTSVGEKKVTYRSFVHIPYVAKPVDKDYQSLNVSVPVEIDGKFIDASDAPILFVIGVGGYMSVNNARTGKGGLQGGPGRSPAASGSISSREDLALAAGYVVVAPGCRGRDNKAVDGTYYGKAPAAIVDLKAAVRYIRHNKGILPGNVEKIVSIGCSAGGALSALLGTSGNSPLYEKYLKEIGAANEKDDIFAAACFSPITDLEHADMAYEWNFGNVPGRFGKVDQALSEQLKNLNAHYQSSLQLKGRNNFGILSAANYDEYLLKHYLFPAADRYLNELPEEKRSAYLDDNKWIKWTGKKSTFTFIDYAVHAGRMKGLPAFDDFAMKQPEPSLFGNKTIDSRHFTNFSLIQSSGNQTSEIDSEVKELVNMMNAMYFLGQNKSDCSEYWWLRNGTSDNHTSQTVMVNLATSLENLNKQVNALLFWDGGHCSDYDPEGFINWIGELN